MKTLLVAMLLAPLGALAADPVRKADADLDGDGKSEAISLEGTAGVFTLKIGAATLTADVPANSEIEGFSVQDIDGADKKKEIAIHSVGEMDDDHLVVFYAWDGKKIRELGRVTPFEDLKGNGVILTSSWAGFWKRTEKHVLDAKAGKLVAVPQELYYVGQEGKVKKTFPLQRSRTDKSVIANVADASTVLVLACAPMPGAKPKEIVNWYLVRTASGLLGWTTEPVLSEGVELPWAG